MMTSGPSTHSVATSAFAVALHVGAHLGDGLVDGLDGVVADPGLLGAAHALLVGHVDHGPLRGVGLVLGPLAGPVAPCDWVITTEWLPMPWHAGQATQAHRARDVLAFQDVIVSGAFT